MISAKELKTHKSENNAHNLAVKFRTQLQHFSKYVRDVDIGWGSHVSAVDCLAKAIATDEKAENRIDGKFGLPATGKIFEPLEENPFLGSLTREFEDFIFRYFKALGYNIHVGQVVWSADGHYIPYTLRW